MNPSPVTRCPTRAVADERVWALRLLLEVASGRPIPDILSIASRVRAGRLPSLRVSTWSLAGRPDASWKPPSPYSRDTKLVSPETASALRVLLEAAAGLPTCDIHSLTIEVSSLCVSAGAAVQPSGQARKEGS